jgi:hypothetical protein
MRVACARGCRVALSGGEQGGANHSEGIVMRSRSTIAATTGAVLIAGAVLAGGGSAQAPAARTLVFSEGQRGSTFKFIDNPPRSRGRTERTTTISMGDVFVFTNPLINGAGRRSGVLYATCVAARGGRFDRTFLLCHGVAKLQDGDIALEVATRIGGFITGSIVGGTGAYNGARGTFTSREPEGRPSVDTFQLLP